MKIDLKKICHQRGVDHRSVAGGNPSPGTAEDARKRLDAGAVAVAANHSRQWTGEVGLFRHRQMIYRPGEIRGLLRRKMPGIHNTL